MSCLDCKHFDEPLELCKLANARPPVRVIVNRCPSYANAIDEVIEHHVRSGNLDFTAKPRPAPASRYATASYTPIKQPSKDAYQSISPDDIPF